jgi:predicted RNase H-like nuclease (RuvC/YqgF family)
MPNPPSRADYSMNRVEELMVKVSDLLTQLAEAERENMKLRHKVSLMDETVASLNAWRISTGGTTCARCGVRQ